MTCWTRVRRFDLLALRGWAVVRRECLARGHRWGGADEFGWESAEGLFHACLVRCFLLLASPVLVLNCLLRLMPDSMVE